MKYSDYPIPHTITTEKRMHGLTKPTANTSIPALRAEANDLHKRAQALTAERADLALPSILGDTAAKARIADIDNERTVLAARVETIEAAIRSLQKQDQQTSWRKHLPNLERAFRVELSQLYDNWPEQLNRLMLGRQSHDLRSLREALQNLDRIERDTAHEIVNRILPDARMPVHDAGDQDALIRARAEHNKLIEQRNAHVQAAVQELLGITVKRPRALQDAVARAQQRLAASEAGSRGTHAG
jgi:hypothetical protein